MFDVCVQCIFGKFHCQNGELDTTFVSVKVIIGEGSKSRTREEMGIRNWEPQEETMHERERKRECGNEISTITTNGFTYINFVSVRFSTIRKYYVWLYIQLKSR